MIEWLEHLSVVRKVAGPNHINELENSHCSSSYSMKLNKLVKILQRCEPQRQIFWLTGSNHSDIRN